MASHFSQVFYITKFSKFCSLYAEVLKFEQVDRELGYYADGEDGLFMRRDLVHHALVHGIPPAEKKRFFAGRKLEGMLKHNAEHEKCSPGKVCEVWN